jgi:integrase/recombinase XerD
VVKRKDAGTFLKADEGILRFEANTNLVSFKRFHIEQATKFRDRLNRDVSKQTGKPLSRSTIRSVNKGFIFWLANQSGYKSRVRHSDADHFNMNARAAASSALSSS